MRLRYHERRRETACLQPLQLRCKLARGPCSHFRITTCLMGWLSGDVRLDLDKEIIYDFLRYIIYDSLKTEGIHECAALSNLPQETSRKPEREAALLFGSVSRQRL